MLRNEQFHHYRHEAPERAVDDWCLYCGKSITLHDLEIGNIIEVDYRGMICPAHKNCQKG